MVPWPEPLICLSLTRGAPGSLAGFAVPLFHVPLAMLWEIGASSIKVMLSPFLMVIEDWSKFVAFICTWLEAPRGAAVVVLQAVRVKVIALPWSRMAKSFFDIFSTPFVLYSCLISLGYAHTRPFAR